MKRRAFIKSVGALGATAAMPFNHEFFIKQARANTPTYSQLQFANPTVMPQVINIFLYGGPSELAGNLTNIADISANSQNTYPGDILTSFDSVTAPNGEVTVNGTWRSAGGHEMEKMLADGEMSLYRTINRVKDNTRAHRPSIKSSLTGNLDYDNYPGMGATLAASLKYIEDSIGTIPAVGKPLDQMVLPFVSFEGESSAFQPDGDNPVPLYLKDISLDTNFSNPYTRTGIGEDVLDALADPKNQATQNRYKSVYDALEVRKELETRVGGLAGELSAPLPMLTGADVSDADLNDGTGRLRYPPQGNNSNGTSAYSERIKAAVTLAIANPDSLFITVGGGLGGWDDHDNAIDKYERRMSALMRTIRAAMKHIKNTTRPAPFAAIPTDNIVINVHGDFGRNVNLNGSMGWDHGNNQNLYTFGGAAVRPLAAMGKIVGTTERFGSSGQNRQFTRPTPGSDSFEPMSIASTVYSYFGIQNPDVLTRDPAMNPQGDNQIDETVAGETLGVYVP